MTEELLHRLQAVLWDTPPRSRLLRELQVLGRHLYVTIRDVVDGELTMRAMSLVYSTLLSVVPMLALTFSILKALGAHNALRPVMLELLRPLGPDAPLLTARIVGFVEGVDVGVLSTVGVVLLLYAALSVVEKVEDSFNHIWHVEQPRPLAQRIGEYLAMIVIAPVVIFIALGLTGTMRSSHFVAVLAGIEPFGALLYAVTRVLPYLLIVGMFCFMYLYLPNTRVRLRPAFWGAVLAGALWQASSAAFATFVAGTGNYNAIYSGFAIVILLLIWLYVAWLILLVGCQTAFHLQHPEYLQPHRAAPLLWCRWAEDLALRIAAVIAGRARERRPPPTAQELARHLDARPEHVAIVVDSLISSGFVADTGDGRGSLRPTQDPDSIAVADLLIAVRHYMPARFRGEALAQQGAGLLDLVDAGIRSAAGGRSLQQWMDETAAGAALPKSTSGPGV